MINCAVCSAPLWSTDVCLNCSRNFRAQQSVYKDKLNDIACYLLAFLENPCPANRAIIEAFCAKHTDMSVMEIRKLQPQTAMQAQVEKHVDQHIAHFEKVLRDGGLSPESREYSRGWCNAYHNVRCFVLAFCRATPEQETKAKPLPARHGRQFTQAEYEAEGGKPEGDRS